MLYLQKNRILLFTAKKVFSFIFLFSARGAGITVPARFRAARALGCASLGSLKSPAADQAAALKKQQAVKTGEGMGVCSEGLR